MVAKIAKPIRVRLKGRNYWYSILVTKRCLDVKFSTIANWMGITTSNLTSMISQHLNPYPYQWKLFKVGVKSRNTCRCVWIEENKISVCSYRECEETFILWAHNKKYCCAKHGKLERSRNAARRR